MTNTESGEEEQEVEECNIWEEPPDSKENITFEANKDNTVQNIETATLNILIQRLTSPDEYSLFYTSYFRDYQNVNDKIKVENLSISL